RSRGFSPANASHPPAPGTGPAMPVFPDGLPRHRERPPPACAGWCRPVPPRLPRRAGAPVRAGPAGHRLRRSPRPLPRPAPPPADRFHAEVDLPVPSLVAVEEGDERLVRPEQAVEIEGAALPMLARLLGVGAAARDQFGAAVGADVPQLREAAVQAALEILHR